VQLEEHSWICFCKRHEKRRLKQRGKHPIKIWGGISKQGATKLVMLSGIMNANRLMAAYEAGLLPFLREGLKEDHRLYQNNDPKHSSKKSIKEKGINWWYIPPESPDCNPGLGFSETVPEEPLQA